MESASLFNPGFLGSHFNWWIGQIPDDSTWRDNLNASKHENPNDNSGWGFRYKVRIIGLHDREEESIPSDQLPWAHVMYPVTAGSGHGATSATPAIRQGSFVFGFFLDGSEQQIPVIMGVLGNNSQIKMSLTTGITQTNFAPVSAFATGANPDTNLKIPDSAIAVNSDTNPAIEAPDPHLKSVADVKREEIYNKKIVLLNPCDIVGSSMKGIFLKIQELTQYVYKYLNAGKSYLDAATNLIGNIQSVIANISCEIAKYLSFIFNKIREFIIKQINSIIEPTIQNLPPNKRNLFVTIKEKIIEIIYCIFTSIIDELCGQIENYLKQKINVIQFPQTSITPFTQVSPVCTSEDLTSDILSTNMVQIDNGIQSVLNILNSFLNDISKEISAANGILSKAISLTNQFDSSIQSALSFSNIKLNIFGCEIAPRCSFTDYYSLKSGGGASNQNPSIGNLSSDRAQTISNIAFSSSEFLVPPLAT